jgi:hypothetical protein
VGVALPVLLAAQLLPAGTALGAFEAPNALAQAAATRWGLFPAALILITGLWILFSTQVGVVEGFARSVTDILWTASPRVRAWRGGNASRVYMAAVGLLVCGGGVGLQVAPPLTLILIGGNVAAANLVLVSAHTLWVNRTLLPPELRPSLWREAAVAAGGLFFVGLLASALARHALPGATGP